MNVNKLKQVVKFPDRLSDGLIVDNGDRINFNKPIVAENCWEIELDADEYELKGILDVRSGC